MLDVMIEWAAQPSTAWGVLVGAGIVFAIQAFRISPSVFWNDLIEEDE